MLRFTSTKSWELWKEKKRSADRQADTKGNSNSTHKSSSWNCTLQSLLR